MDIDQETALIEEIERDIHSTEIAAFYQEVEKKYGPRIEARIKAENK